MVKEKMLRAAYGNTKTTALEWMVNLFIIMYYKEFDINSGFETTRIWTRINTNNGFIWMGRSVDFMKIFYENRKTYQHIENFSNQLINFLGFCTDNLDYIVREYETREPYIKEVYPELGSDISDTDEIRVTFSEPMRMDC